MLSFHLERIKEVLGFEIDHSFINIKRSCRVLEPGENISIKGQTVELPQIAV
jgi:hypothetical protein